MVVRDLETLALRAAQAAIGGWILASAFLWPHHTAEFVNAIVVGAASIAIAVASLFVPRLHFLNVPLALWLFSSWVVLPVQRMGTFYTDIVFGVLLVLTSLGEAPPRIQGAVRQNA